MKTVLRSRGVPIAQRLPIVLLVLLAGHLAADGFENPGWDLTVDQARMR